MATTTNTPRVGDVVVSHLNRENILADVIGYHATDIVVKCRESGDQCLIFAKSELRLISQAVVASGDGTGPTIANAWVVA